MSEPPKPAAATAPKPSPEAEPKREVNGKPKDPYKSLQIGWKDGLPADRTEDVANEVALKTAGLTSTYSAILRLNDGDADAAEKEMARIEEEQQKSMLQEVAMGGGPPPPQGEGQQANEAAQIVAASKSKKGGVTDDTRRPDEGGREPGTPPAST
jgi:hypothetical protein